jgi:hypothetical protein
MAVWGTYQLDAGCIPAQTFEHALPLLLLLLARRGAV